ncbi:MAG: transcription-repair coupling factor, partial [Spirochaetaceae bacterium]|nr:transcription-repair coupling factor [Spirochaetaceae bacterium]
MNTLPFPLIQNKISASPGIAAFLDAYKRGEFPLELDGCEGALPALLLAALWKAHPGVFLVVVSTEREAAELVPDLEILGAPVLSFPWWGTMPYREMAPLSAVFGERTGVLAALTSGEPVMVVASERAFLTPLPPPEYFKKLLITLKPGGAIDTAALTEILVGYGYTRVPRVQIHGEFALRGEVLDILMGGDEDAYRVLFDF